MFFLVPRRTWPEVQIIAGVSAIVSIQPRKSGLVGARIHLKFQLVRHERLHLLRADGNTCLVRLVQLQLDPSLESNFTIKIRESSKIDYALAEFDEIPGRVFAQITRGRPALDRNPSSDSLPAWKHIS